MGHSVSLTRIKGFVRHKIRENLFFVPESMASFFGDSLLSSFFFVSVLLFTCYSGAPTRASCAWDRAPYPSERGSSTTGFCRTFLSTQIS